MRYGPRTPQLCRSHFCKRNVTMKLSPHQSLYMLPLSKGGRGGRQISAPQEGKGRETDRELRLAFTTHNCTAWEMADPVVQMGDRGGCGCTELKHYLGDTQSWGAEPWHRALQSSSHKSNRCRTQQVRTWTGRSISEEGNGREEASNSPTFSQSVRWLT